MNVILVLYCAENAELAQKEIDKPPVLQEKMFISFIDMMVRVEKIVWAEDYSQMFICCGLILKSTQGPREGYRLIFPFGKIPQILWNPEKYQGWQVSTADSVWDAVLSPVIEVQEVDGDGDNFTGED